MKLCWRSFGIFSALWLIVAGRADAQIKIHQLPIDDGPPLLLLEGLFDPSDDPAMLGLAAKASQASFVTFDSNGGNVVAAMAFGRMIRALGLSTIQPRSAQCASACALAFAGGVQRWAEPGSIGVHQSSFKDPGQVPSEDAVTAVQLLTGMILEYLAEMGVEPLLLQLSLRTPSNDMRYLSAHEMAELRVTTTSGGHPALATYRNRGANQPATELKDEQDIALTFLNRYFDAWSSGNEKALVFIERAYANRVLLGERLLGRKAVFSEKRSTAYRWPNRAFIVVPGTEQISCEGHCTIAAVVEWYMQDRLLRAVAGRTSYTFIIDGTTGSIIAEDSRVLVFEETAEEPEWIVSYWHDTDQECQRKGENDWTRAWACSRREATRAKLEGVGWCLILDEPMSSPAWVDCTTRSDSYVATGNLDRGRSQERPTTIGPYPVHGHEPEDAFASSLYADPMGFLFFGPTLGMEFGQGNFSFLASLRIMNLGAIPALTFPGEGEKLLFSYGVAIKARRYWEKNLVGAFLGLQAEYIKASVALNDEIFGEGLQTNSTYLFPGIELGYRAAIGQSKQAYISPSILLGVAQRLDANVNGVPDTEEFVEDLSSPYLSLGLEFGVFL